MFNEQQTKIIKGMTPQEIVAAAEKVIADAKSSGDYKTLSSFLLNAAFMFHTNQNS